MSGWRSCSPRWGLPGAAARALSGQGHSAVPDADHGRRSGASCGGGAGLAGPAWFLRRSRSRSPARGVAGLCRDQAQEGAAVPGPAGLVRAFARWLASLAPGIPCGVWWARTRHSKRLNTPVPLSSAPGSGHRLGPVGRRYAVLSRPRPDHMFSQRAAVTGVFIPKRCFASPSSLRPGTGSTRPSAGVDGYLASATGAWSFRAAPRRPPKAEGPALPPALLVAPVPPGSLA